MSFTIGQLMDEAALDNDREGMKAIGFLYYNWFERNDYELNPQTAKSGGKRP